MGLGVATPVEARVAARERRKGLDLGSIVESVREALEALLWVAGAVGLVAYGDGEKDLVRILALGDERVGGVPSSVAVVSFLLNVLVFAYLALFLPYARGDRRPWDEAAPWAVPVGTLCGATTFVSLTWALLPIYGWFTPLVVVVLFLGFMLGLCYIPSLTLTAEAPKRD